MKKWSCLFALIVILSSCNRHIYTSVGACYRVYKIELNNEYYEIYARQGGRYFKIVSKAEGSDTGIRIRRGGCYEFVLRSHYDVFKETFGIEMMPTHRIGEIGLSENTTTKIDGGKIITIYYAQNLRGLYVVE